MRLSWMPDAPRATAVPSWLAPPPPDPVPIAVPNTPLPVIEMPAEPAAPIDCGHEEEIASLRAALAESLARMASMRGDMARAVEADLVRLAAAIGERIAGATVEPATVVAWAKEGVALIAERAPLVVRVSPEIANAVPQETWSGVGAELRADPSLPKWGCVVEGADARADVGFSARVRAVLDALGVEP